MCPCHSLLQFVMKMINIVINSWWNIIFEKLFLFKIWKNWVTSVTGNWPFFCPKCISLSFLLVCECLPLSFVGHCEFVFQAISVELKHQYRKTCLCVNAKCHFVSRFSKSILDYVLRTAVFVSFRLVVPIWLDKVRSELPM